MTACIYIIENLADKKVYIGQTINFKDRKKYHYCHLRANTHYNQFLQRAYNKYGASYFKISVLEKCTPEELDEKECGWISFFNACNNKYGYNAECGGNSKKVVSESTRAKMSQSAKNRYYSNRKSPGMLQGWSGFRHSAETRKKLSEMRKGAVFSDEHRAKLSAANKGKTISAQAKEKQSQTMRNNTYNTVQATPEMIEDVKNGMQYRQFAKKYNTYGVWRRIRRDYVDVLQIS